MLTLKELKKMVKVADAEERIPKAKALKANGSIVVKEVINAETDIAVYENGYVLYQEGMKTTVFPLHTCKEYEYQDADGGSDRLKEEFFDNENWYIRLLMEASDRMEYNQEKILSNHGVFSYSAVVEERKILIDRSADVLDQLVQQEMIRELFTCLTKKQKEVIQLYFFEELSQKEIAEYMGIKQQSVFGTLKRALAVMKEYAEAEEK